MRHFGHRVLQLMFCSEFITIVTTFLLENIDQIETGIINIINRKYINGKNSMSKTKLLLWFLRATNKIV